MVSAVLLRRSFAPELRSRHVDGNLSAPFAIMRPRERQQMISSYLTKAMVEDPMHADVEWAGAFFH